jgi:hypothetical protein
MCISSSSVKCLFSCLEGPGINHRTTCMLDKCSTTGLNTQPLFKSLLHLLIGMLDLVFTEHLEFFIYYSYKISVILSDLKVFCTNCGLSFHSQQSFSVKYFNFDEVKFIIFFLLWIMLLLIYPRTLCLTKDHKDFCMFSSCKNLCFTYKPMTHFELIFA